MSSATKEDGKSVFFFFKILNFILFLNFTKPLSQKRGSVFLFPILFCLIARSRLTFAYVRIKYERKSILRREISIFLKDVQLLVVNVSNNLRRPHIFTRAMSLCVQGCPTVP